MIYCEQNQAMCTTANSWLSVWPTKLIFFLHVCAYDENVTQPHMHEAFIQKNTQGKISHASLKMVCYEEWSMKMERVYHYIIQGIRQT